MVFDDAKTGRLLLCEVNSTEWTWQMLKTGQRQVYESIVKAGNGRITAVLLQHGTNRKDKIDTRNDIKRWQLMAWRAGIVYSPDHYGDWWPVYVEHWFKNEVSDAWWQT